MSIPFTVNITPKEKKVKLVYSIFSLTVQSNQPPTQENIDKMVKLNKMFSDKSWFIKNGFFIREEGKPKTKEWIRDITINTAVEFQNRQKRVHAQNLIKITHRTKVWLNKEEIIKLYTSEFPKGVYVCIKVGGNYEENLKRYIQKEYTT